jgi:two-component system cell cycle sensor histidine kinase/response regulator CckA
VSRTILVVEDEDLFLLAVTKALTKRGFSVIEACNGSVAMELLRGHKNELDVVLLDVTLPGVSSREILEEARRIRPELKVILTSAYSKENIAASFAGLGVERFIRKPFKLNELVGGRASRHFVRLCDAKRPLRSLNQLRNRDLFFKSSATVSAST